METHTKFLLDSGDPDEYKHIAALAKEKGQELWGSTTNPSLIAKKLASPERSRRITQKEAFQLQKEIVLQILEIVPGAVSAEVYADKDTKAEDMILQGQEIATWHKRVVVKFPTNIEGFKARTELRKAGITTNNTLVFSQRQIFAICLHEQIITRHSGKPKAHPESDSGQAVRRPESFDGELRTVEPLTAERARMTKEIAWPPFISPFVGRLDDQQEDGMTLVENGMKIKKQFNTWTWMLTASIRRMEHMKRSILMQAELITAPAKVYEEWFNLTDEQIENLSNDYAKDLKPLDLWIPSAELQSIGTLDDFMKAIASGTLDITHPLTEKGIVKFAEDWKTIIA